jgi:hypothetical protein
MSVQTNRTALTAAIAGVAALGGLAEPTCADFYEFTFGGVIDVVDGIVPEPWETVHVGSEFEFSYIFDSEAEDQAPASWFGIYDILWAQLTIEGAAQETLGGEIYVINLADDSYIVNFWDLPIGAGGDVHLTGSDPIDSDELPLDINLDDWGINQGFEGGGDGWRFAGTVVDFSGKIVPNVGTLWLMAIASLLGKRRQRWFRD